LSEQLHEPDAYAEELTKAEASKRIDALKVRRREPPLAQPMLSRRRNIEGSILTARNVPSIWPRMKLRVLTNFGVLTNSVTRRRRTGAARARVRA